MFLQSKCNKLEGMRTEARLFNSNDHGGGGGGGGDDDSARRSQSIAGRGSRL